VREFRRGVNLELPSTRSGVWNVFRSSVAVIFATAASLVLVLFLAMLALSCVALSIQVRAYGVARVVGQSAVGFAVVLGAGFLAFRACRMIFEAVVRDAKFSNHWRRVLRLHHFALDNGLAYVKEIANPRRSGVIFGAGSNRRAFDVLSTDDGSFEMGNFQYAGNWKRERALRRFGYFRIHLPERLPNIVLESRRNRRSFGRSNLPWQFSSSQTLSLEGDFDRYFTLHVPAGYELDALYLFTPDLMALFVDRAADFDVEIVDEWLYVYSPKPFRMLEQGTYDRLFAILDTVGRKTLDRAARYTDGRPTVDTTQTRPGARLRRSIPVGPIIVALAFGTLVALRLFFNI
jgi:hypothetical protein